MNCCNNCKPEYIDDGSEILHIQTPICINPSCECHKDELKAPMTTPTSEMEKRIEELGGCNSHGYMCDECKNDTKKLIKYVKSLLASQRQEIEKDIEGLTSYEVTEDVKNLTTGQYVEFFEVKVIRKDDALTLIRNK